MRKDDRKQMRVPLFGVAEVKVEDNDTGLFLKALTQNISLTGMGLYMYQTLKPGLPVSITIRFTQKDGKRPSDTVHGIVASVTEMETSYCIGVEFDNPLNPEDQPNLYPHLMYTIHQD